MVPVHPRWRAISLGRAIERLMVLDAILAEPDVTWLGLSRDKVAAFTAPPFCLPPHDVPHTTIGGIVRPFPDPCPIGVAPDGSCSSACPSPAWRPRTKPRPRAYRSGRGAVNARSYFGARYYRADLGRFTTVDPELNIKDALVDPQRWNRYAYARNNPLRYTDPNGRDVVPVYLPMSSGKLELTFLDTRIADRVASVVLEVNKAGGAVVFSEAFRTAADQQDMVDRYPAFANKTFTSPHMVGLAFDVKQSQMTKESMAALETAAKAQGFGNVTVNGKLETWHFQANEFITRGKDGSVDSAYKAMLQTNQAQAVALRTVFTLLRIPLILPSAQ